MQFEKMCIATHGDPGNTKLIYKVTCSFPSANNELDANLLLYWNEVGGILPH